MCYHDIVRTYASKLGYPLFVDSHSLA